MILRPRILLKQKRSEALERHQTISRSELEVKRNNAAKQIIIAKSSSQCQDTVGGWGQGELLGSSS